MKSDALNWIHGLKKSVPAFLDTLKVSGQPGRFLPCRLGLTEAGKRAALGFSCFAAKSYYTLGLWERLPEGEKKQWITFINSFQTAQSPPGDEAAKNAFVDPPIVSCLAAQVSWKTKVRSHLLKTRQLTPLQGVVMAETKQAIATLAQVGEGPARTYSGFPDTEASVKAHLARLDWNAPWGAGGQAAALVVFIRTQAPSLMREGEAARLLQSCSDFFDTLADAATGTYFSGRTPDRGQLVNGAMKVLTALDWLETPIHYPEKLIDTCLREKPDATGCHIVDYIYLLYRTLQVTDHRRQEIEAICVDLVDMIRSHFNAADGGFSYWKGKAQTTYYGVPISTGQGISDIHGTVLLTWALAMILDILGAHSEGWQVMRP